MNAAAIASKAAELVGGDRAAQHGDKAVNMANIAKMWNAYLTTRRHPAEPLDGIDICHMMVLMKLARTQTGTVNLDDWQDLVGYGAIAGQLATEPA